MMSASLILIDRYNKLVLRQRIVLLIAFLSIIYFVFYLLFFLPLSENSEKLKIENNYLSSLQKEAGQLEDEKKALDNTLDDALGMVLLNNKLNALKNEVHDLNVELKKYFSIVNSDNDLMSIVKDLVNTPKGIRLEAIELLPVESIVVSSHRDGQEIDGEAARENASDSAYDGSEQKNSVPAVVYKHKVYIKLEGSYAGLTRYLNQIESLGWGLFMQDIHYKLDKHPNANVGLLVYSLSLGDVNVF